MAHWRAVVQRLEHGLDGYCAGQRRANGLAVPQFTRRGVAADLLLDARYEVEFDDLAAIGGIGKLEAKNFGIVFGLLQTVTSG